MSIDHFSGRYDFLSNFYPCRIVFPYNPPIIFPSVEHYFQAMKTKNEVARRYMARIPTAARAKQIGRESTLRDDWEQIKDQVMMWGLRKKFTPGSDLARRLVTETGDEYLIEGNTWNDRYWGTCRGYGLNKLGHMLMELRAELDK